MSDHDPCDLTPIQIRAIRRRERPWLLPIAVLLLICVVVVVGPLVLIATAAEACLIVARGAFRRLTSGVRNYAKTVGSQDSH